MIGEFEKNKKQEKVKKLSEKNFLELRNFLEKLVKNFGEINHDDKKILEKEDNSEVFIIGEFKKILNRRSRNGEKGIMFLIQEIKEGNKKIYNFFKEEIKNAKETLKKSN